MKKRFGFAAALILAAAALAGCSNDSENSSKTNEDKLKVYTTIFPLEDFTKKIGGDYVDVTSIYPPNADAHTYEPSSKTLVEMAEGDAFIYSGVGEEGFADKAAESLKSNDVNIVKAGEGIELLSEDEEHAHEGEEAHDHGNEAEHNHESEAGHEEEGHHHDKDPHVWLDPVLSIQIAENIKNSLTKMDPDHEKTYTENFNSLKKELEQLDTEFKETVKKADKKEILVSHAAYGYWHERYGIEQISVLGLSPTQEPSQKELQTLVETAKEHDIKYVIFESNVTSKISTIVKNEIGADSLTLHNLESISEEDEKNGEDYFSLMQKNLDTLKKALSN
ncbi:metal ABC transporter substrate-binding protein [Bacillus gobiensis]|uniref:metal ABC transporter substrate-binding protein n=1 Tax=Bacillus gobiensis TaxID=1441095 RepID=UPI003D1C2E0A